MNCDSLLRSLKANRAYYANMFAPAYPTSMQIKAEKRWILVGLYQEMIDLESRLQIIEGEFGYKYSPDQPRVPAGSPDGGQWTSGGGDNGDDDNSGNETQLAQEIFPPSLLLDEPPVIVRPPIEQLPEDPTIPPAPGYNEWRGPDAPGGPRGGWFNKDTRESLHPDMDNEEEGSHWDYVDPMRRQWRIWPDGSMTPKVVVGGLIA